MANSILLRFRDVANPTVALHRSIVGELGATWWGWWKKQSESANTPELLRLSRALPADVGLFDASANTFYIARCEDIALASGGEPFPCPQPELTPNYYRDERLPAWFRFSEIADSSSDDFVNRFGGVPRRNETLYAVDDVGSRPQIRLAEPDPANESDAPGNLILHLSDLHFGDDHGFPLTQVAGQRRPLLQTITTGLEAAAEETGERVGIVIVSGDLTSKGQGFDAAEAFLTSLQQKLGLTREHFIFAPGNHDISLDSANLVNYEHNFPYIRFLRSFLVRDVTKPEELRTVNLPNGRRLRIASLNSVRLRDESSKEYGFIGSDVFDPILQQLSHDAQENEGVEGSLNLVVLHHHVLPTPLTVYRPEEGRSASMTLDAGGLIEACQVSSIHAILHGHHHFPFVAQTSRARQTGLEWTGLDERLFVLGNGSSGARVERLEEALPYNSYGLYHASLAGVLAEFWSYNATVLPTRYLSMNLPL